MNYLELKFHLSPDSQIARELLIAIAGEAGCDSFVVENEFVTGYCMKESYNKELLLHGISNFPLPGTKILFDVSDVQDKNWNEEWENNGFKPIVIDDRCVVCNSNTPNPTSLIDSDSRDNHQPLIVRINPRQAFGSGAHETTQMIIGELLDMDLKNKDILDCGCGTGILGIVASMRGADNVYGYDIDEWSVRNAIDNAFLNNTKIKVKHGNCHIINQLNMMFDVIMANINRNILLEDMPIFKTALKDDGILILSGFYADDVPLLLEKAKTLKLCQNRLIENHKWCCLVLQPE